MRIHLPAECEAMLEQRRYQWNMQVNTLCFMLPQGEDKPLPVPVDDTIRFMYQHSPAVIESSIMAAVTNLPAACRLLDQLNIYLVPRPPHSLFGHYQNAEQYHRDTVMFAKGTQIPHGLTAYVATHEFGHYVQFHLCPIRMPEDRAEFNPAWIQYLKLRGFHHEHEVKCWRGEGKEPEIEIHPTYERFESYGFQWHQNPQEWFAEDFRYLFGSDAARQDFWGLEIPEPGPEIREFMMSLGERS